MELNFKDFEILVPSLEEPLAFYQYTLGLPLRFRNETFADFDLGVGSRLALWKVGHAVETCGENAVGTAGNRMMGSFRLKSKDAIDQAFSEFKSKNVNVIQTPKVWPWGKYSFYFTDPNEYLWEVFTTDQSKADGFVITEVSFFVEDLERSLAFYRDNVGLTVKRSDQWTTEFQSGEAAFCLKGVAAFNKELGSIITPNGHRCIGAFQFDTGEEVTEYYRQLCENEVEFVTDLIDWPWGARAAYFKDPDGFLWEIYAWVGKPYTW